MIASWFIREVRLEPTWPSLFCFEAIDQRNIKSLDLIANLLIIVNNIIVNIDFYVFEITNWSQSYSIIWDQSYLWEVNAINYWKYGQIKIGLKNNHVKIRVMK